MAVEPVEPTAFLEAAEAETTMEQRDLPRYGDIGPTGYGNPGSAFAEVAITAVGTAAVLPFLQALATQAGNSAFEAARRLLTRWVRDPGSSTPLVVDEGETLRVIDEGDGRLTFEVPSGLPDEALEALTRINLEALAAPSRDGGKVLIRWDPDGCEWSRTIM
ncbi:hypothetical protein RM550_18765 [Streptomyces sp. DSM 41527]|uniref:Uncharacterized protein n=1 Tax=Streptomyces mooreae TaxID=3075523 RepID=A0ABU2T9Y9_9ACTN|nr:hypothetical protein [Streptomyces sp. DSM 41527]MDT0457755.1 hypothetical protein [Streptomyces sp. DSM 41527]